MKTPPRILIVDDTPANVDILQMRLRAHGYDIVTATDGEAALVAVRDTQPDLILLDVMMPKLDGFEVLELIGADPTVIFVTAYDTYAMRAFDVHAVDYLLKPFSQERFEAALERARQRILQQTPQKMPEPAELAAAARPPSEAPSFSAITGLPAARAALQASRNALVLRTPSR